MEKGSQTPFEAIWGFLFIMESICKICIVCKEEKFFKEFNKKSSGAFGLTSKCKDCLKLDYQKNREKILENKKIYQSLNKEKIKSKKAENYIKNKDVIQAKNKEGYEKHRLERIKKQTEYYQINRIVINKKTNQRVAQKRKFDNIFRLRSNIRTLVRNSFKRACNGEYNKSSNTEKILGCTMDEFILHIQSLFTEGMSLDKMGDDIHIDHKIPLVSAKDEEDIIRLCHYTNLQPMWALDNLKKGSTLS